MNIKYFGIALLLVACLSACEKPGPAETAGKKIDQTVGDAGRQISDSVEKASNKAGVAIDDTEITAKIKAAFLAEHGLKTLQISVETDKGVVTLSGSADTLANSEMAKALAGAVAGVSRVKNQLVIKTVK
jgi:acyl CoA:acetate/3-ketoacid CoA transferase